MTAFAWLALVTVNKICLIVGLLLIKDAWRDSRCRRLERKAAGEAPPVPLETLQGVEAEKDSDESEPETRPTVAVEPTDQVGSTIDTPQDESQVPLSKGSEASHSASEVRRFEVLCEQLLDSGHAYEQRFEHIYERLDHPMSESSEVIEELWAEAEAALEAWIADLEPRIEPVVAAMEEYNEEGGSAGDAEGVLFDLLAQLETGLSNLRMKEEDDDPAAHRHRLERDLVAVRASASAFLSQFEASNSA